MLRRQEAVFVDGWGSVVKVLLLLRRRSSRHIGGGLIDDRFVAFGGCIVVEVDM